MFRVGAVVAQSFQTFVRNFIPFSVISGIGLIAVWVFSYIAIKGFGDPFAAMNSLTDEQAAMEFFDAYKTEIIIRTAIYAVVSVSIILAIHAAIIYGAIIDLRGKNANLGELAGKGFATVPKAFAISVLLSLAMFFLSFAVMFAGATFGLTSSRNSGIIVLIVFALFFILMSRWYVAIPVLVVENTGVFEAFRRSTELSSGHRWKIFGLILLGLMLSFAFSILTSVLFGGGSGAGMSFVSKIIQQILLAPVLAFGAVLVAVAYHDLRVAKENPGAG